MTNKVIFLVAGIFLLAQFSACTYFKINRSQDDLRASIENVGKLYKRFILHAEDKVFEIKNITIQNDIISGNLISNPLDVLYTPGRKYRYKWAEKDIKYEVHLYMNESIELKDGLLAMPINDINVISIIESDSGKNIASFAGGTVGVLGLVVVVALATKSSCPYIYVHDGDGYVFEGETYGGAVAANLARHDYMPLPSIRAVDGQYKLRLNNELKEHQFTDIAELIVVNHREDQKILLDKYGKPHLIKNPVQAIDATDENGRNLLSTIASDDTIPFLFDEIQTSSHAAAISFEKPDRAKNANLIIKAKNTMWFDYLYGEAISKFGSSYNAWSEAQAQLSREDHLQEVLDGGFPLFIYIQKNGEWKLVDYLFTIGPLASREFLIPIDISDIQENEIKVKLETGFMFWELEYAHIDYTPNTHIQSKNLTATSAIGSFSKDWTSELKRQDFDYMVQKNIGEITEMTFEVPQTEVDEIQSVFLHTYGYYRLIREFEGAPQMFELQKFKTLGYFSEYSKSEYLNVIKTTKELANINHKSELDILTE